MSNSKMTLKTTLKATLVLSLLIAGSLVTSAALATSKRVVVPIDAECPSGMWPIAPAYERVDGRWVRVGTLCEEAMRGG